MLCKIDKMKKEVLIIFKTHLDLGFTDYSANILKKYLTEYIPNAIKVGNELKNTATPFVWTVGSFIINEALKHDKDGTVDRAIKDGILTWHALPFTTHTELMNRSLFEYGLDISKKLDEKYGKNTVAAKMTDVPGHTRAMIPSLSSRGIKFLHIGVNPATPVPPVPPLFRWKDGENSVTVMYQSDYGEVVDFDDFVVFFAHTHDNQGPQNADEIRMIYDYVKKKYPDHDVKASTLDEAARRLENSNDIPVYDREIGDTWIHGAATDPEKISRFRRLLRYVENNGFGDCDLTDSLLAVPEHTWGLDVKTFFPNKTDFYHQDLEKCENQRSIIEKSWQEQRDYVSSAEKLLGLQKDYDTSLPDLTEFEKCPLPKDVKFEISWQIFDNSDYENYSKNYMRCHDDWAVWDFTKVGLPDYKGGIFMAEIKEAFCHGDEALYRMEFDKDTAEKYGLPYFYVRKKENFIEIKWYGKKLSRIPQACWFKVKNLEENWEINKMDEWIDVRDIEGSPLICAVDKGVRNGKVRIYPLDSPLVAPFGKKLLQYNIKNDDQDMYFNLYNNIWNTNFPLWYSQNALFRFVVEGR